MKISAIAALVVALSLPVAASAQVYQQPPMQGQGQGQGANQGGPGVHQANKWMRVLSGLNLSSQQQQQIQGMLGQYVTQHPAGSPRDPQGIRALRQQIFAALTPDQQAQLRQQMQAMKMQKAQRHLQRLQQQQQQQGQQPPSR